MPPRLRGDGDEDADEDHQRAGDLIEAVDLVAPQQSRTSSEEVAHEER
jgi:hypothetical protein